MKRKLIIILLSLTAALALSFGLAACDNEEEHIHDYGEWTVTVPATCTASGERRQTCECGEYITEEIFPLGHKFSNYVPDGNASCEEDGTKTAKCERCDVTDTVTDKNTALNHVLENHAGQNYDCEVNGWKPYQTCKRDGCGYTTYELLLAHHDYENGYCVRCKKPISDYKTAEDGTYIFSGIGELTDKDVVIPSEVNGIKVTAIGAFAFRKTDVVSVVIPEGVTSLGDEIFEDCSSLKKVVIPDTVTSIRGAVFEGCDSLEYNEIGNGCYLGNDNHPYMVLAKVKDKSIPSVEIPSETKIICSSAFDECTELTNVTIPDNVIELGTFAFYGCTGLETVTLPGTLKEIASFTFSGCSSLKTITIPSGATSIGNSAFERCENLTEIEIPSTVTSIGENAFEGTGLTSIIIPTTVTKLGAGAFYDCANLENAYIFGNVEEIGDYTFFGCSSLISVCLPSSVKTIGADVFGICESLESVFFDGTAEQWADVNIDSTNAANITAENVYFYSQNIPEAAGNYWYWGVEGVPAVWKY